MIKITFLGTGTSQGVPVITCECEVCTSTDPRDQRLRTSILIQSENTAVVIDTGVDFRQQMLRAKVKRLDAIVFTHQHKDHIAGLDDVRPFNFSQNMDMPVYATEAVQKDLKKSFAYIFEPAPYPGIPQLDLHTISKHSAFWINEKIKLLPIEVMHYKMPVLGFRIGDFTYITDAKTISVEEKAKIYGTKVLVLNALHHNEHISHLNLREALAIIDELKPEIAYLTHISHQMGLQSAIEPTLPSNVFFAYDGLELTI